MRGAQHAEVSSYGYQATCGRSYPGQFLPFSARVGRGAHGRQLSPEGTDREVLQAKRALGSGGRFRSIPKSPTIFHLFANELYMPSMSTGGIARHQELDTGADRTRQKKVVLSFSWQEVAACLPGLQAPRETRGTRHVLGDGA